MSTDLSLCDLPLTTRKLHIGGKPFTVTAVADQDALLRATASRDLLPFGMMIWESAIALGEVLARRSLTDQQVLELGAGTGLAGLVAAAHGAHVCQTDIDDLALALCAHNAAANGLTARMTTLPIDWSNWQPARHYDLIIGADVLYDRADHATLAQLLEAALAPHGSALLADPERPDTVRFLDLLVHRGWTVDRQTLHVPDLAAPARNIAVTVIEAVRPAAHAGR